MLLQAVSIEFFQSKIYIKLRFFAARIRHDRPVQAGKSCPATSLLPTAADRRSAIKLLKIIALV
jgi:hypothetical protein